VLFFTRRVQLVTLASYHRLPAIYPDRTYPDIGGLMSYGPDILDSLRQVGVYTGRILKGEKPSELPVTRPNKFKFQFDIIAPDSATGRRMLGRFAQHVAPKAVIRRRYRATKLTDAAASVLLSMAIRMFAITVLSLKPP
jgi:hypothetical protein